MAAQNKKTLNKKFFEDLKSRPMTEEEQERFSRFIHNQKFCRAGEMEAIFKKSAVNGRERIGQIVRPRCGVV